MDPLLPVIGLSMRPLIEQLRLFAAEEETLLLAGPTGVGKSRLARWCHQQSPRYHEPFETLHLLGIPTELQLGELFGWRRGAFTGAVRDNPGSVRRAHRGSLFIDEIDKLSLEAQAALLQFLDERRYRSLGEGGKEQHADVRILVATNADLRAAVAAGHFREDLYYRIHVLPARIPGLDERRDEVVAWASYMIERQHRQREPSTSVILSPTAAQRIEHSPWPGNLRQLDNIMRRAYILARPTWERGVSQRVIEEPAIAQALRLEHAKEPALLPLLERAAYAFVEEALNHGPDALPENAAPPWTLDLADAFRGLILRVACEQTGSRSQALRLLGKGHLVRDHNQRRLWRRESERLSALYRALHLDPPDTLLAP